MTINYTTLLGLAKPVTGTEANTWGDVVNDEITTLVEQAVAGGTTLDVTSGNITLTTTNGTSNQARNAILLVTGTPGTTRNIVAPSQSKVYVVRNGSNAAIVLKGSATTGVSVPAGGTSVVFWNGSDFQTNESMTKAIVSAGTVSAPSITTTGDTNTGIYFPDVDTIAFTEGGVEAMRIDSSGNVGIGTSSPGARLDVQGPNETLFSPNVFNTRIVGTNSATSGNAGAGISFVGYTTGTSLLSDLAFISGIKANTIDGNYDGALVFGVRNSGTGAGSFERMRIDSSGNVGIGTTSPSEKLTLIGNQLIAPNTSNTSADTYVQVRFSGTTDGSPNSVRLGIDGASLNGVAYINTLSAGVASVTPLTFRIGGTERMRIAAGGEVYIAGTTDQGAYNLQCNGTGVWGAGAYVNGSDARIKEDIAPIESGLDVVEKLNPVTYRYKEDWSKDQNVQPGFIAQELLTALEGTNYVDGVVTQGGAQGYYSVAYQNLIPVLTKAIQELKAELDTVKAELNQLKGA